MSIKNVSFIGLGVMGYPMAGHLQNKGYNVTVYNRTTAKAEKWVEEYKGSMAKTPGEASQNSEIVFMCVGRDEDIIEVMEGEGGILSNVAEGSIIVDHTTASAEIARNYYQKLKDKKLSFLDAPVSGGQAGAENGVLSIMIGGDEKDYNAVKPVLTSYGKSIELIGPSGSGQIAKMINQICIAGLCKVYPKQWLLEKNRMWIWKRFLALYQRVQLNHGKWKIDIELCSMANLIMVLQLIGCVRIYQFVLMKQIKMVQFFLLQKLLINTMKKFKKMVAIGLILHPS